MCVYNDLAQVLITLVAWFLLISAVSAWIPDFFFFFCCWFSTKGQRTYLNFGGLLTWCDACLYKFKCRTIRGLWAEFWRVMFLLVVVCRAREQISLQARETCDTWWKQKYISLVCGSGKRIQYRLEPTKFYIEWALFKFYLWLCVFKDHIVTIDQGYKYHVGIVGTVTGQLVLPVFSSTKLLVKIMVSGPHLYGAFLVFQRPKALHNTGQQPAIWGL